MSAQDILLTLDKNVFRHDQDGTYPEENINLIGKYGYFGLLMNEDPGVGWSHFIKFTQALAERCPSTALLYVMHSYSVWVLSQIGSLNTREKYLDKIARGELRASIAVSDDPNHPVTFRSSGNSVIVSGRKQHCSGVHRADVILVQTTPRSGQGGVTFLIPTETPGVTISSERWDGMGLRGQDSCGVLLDEVCIPVDHVLKQNMIEINSYLQYKFHDFAWAAVVHGVAIGMVHAVTPIIQERISKRVPTVAVAGEIMLLLDSSSAMIQYTLDSIKKREEHARMLCASSRVFLTENALKISELCLEIGGTYVYEHSKKFQLLYRDLRGLTLLGPRIRSVKSQLGQNLLQRIQIL